MVPHLITTGVFIKGGNLDVGTYTRGEHYVNMKA